MKKLLSLLFIIVIIVAIVLLSRNSNISTCAVDQSNNPETVFDINLHDAGCGAVALADFRGKPMIVNAWASWCPFCVQELPDFVTLQEEFPDSIAIVAINRQEPVATGQAYLRQQGIENDLVFLYDPADQFYRQINLIGMPVTLFVNAEGDIVDKHSGPLSLSQMRDKVSQLFGLNLE